ncbi:MAG: DUF11 domain-containing protein, partial [Chloroflexi bacterium]|nr:DUF11 domain-containing protein [Chloroflexota bacterium]
MEIRPTTRPSKARIRNLLHTFIVLGMLAQSLIPIPVAAAANRALSNSGEYASYAGVSAPARAVVAPLTGSNGLARVIETETLLGETLLPEWMGEERSQSNVVVGYIGNDILPAWIDDASSSEAPITPAEPTSKLGATLLPSWIEVPVGLSEDAIAPASVLAPAALGSCTPEADLEMNLIKPPFMVSRGNENAPVPGDVYTVTITNNGSNDTTEVNLQVDPNDGFFYLTGTATVSSDTDSPGVSGPGSNTAAGDPFTLTVTAAAPDTTLDVGETITFTFHLATDADATSGQLLTVYLQSGSGPPSSNVITCQQTEQNVPTARGNLVVIKHTPGEFSSSTQDGFVGDLITWTIQLANTGLGNVYDAVMTDTIGVGYINTSVPSASDVDLMPGDSAFYTATGYINACDHLTNTAETSWVIGNTDGTASPGDPLDSQVDVRLLLLDPDIAVEISPLSTYDYCESNLDETAVVTVTNTGGAAPNVVLNLSVSGPLGSVVTEQGDDWTQSGTILTYVGGAPFTPGTLLGGSEITFPIRIQAPGPFCSSQQDTIILQPVAKDACVLLSVTGSAGQTSVPVAADASTLEISKSGPFIANAGDTIVYTVTVSGENQEFINSPIAITDVFPSELTSIIIDTSPGTNVQSGNSVTWTLPVNSTGTYSGQMVVTGTIPSEDGGTCGAGGKLLNSTGALADVCDECDDLVGYDEVETFIQDFLGQNNSFSKGTSPVEMCSTNPAQVITATIDLNVGGGFSWGGLIYTDTLTGTGMLLPLNVVDGSVDVFVDGVDRTGDVTISLGPPLEIDFSAVGTVSNTATITMSYEVTASVNTIPNEPPGTSPFIWSEINVPGATSCVGDSLGFFGTNIDIYRGNLEIAVTPEIISACAGPQAITLTVTGGSPDSTTDNIVITFTAPIGDVFTPTIPISTTFGGDFAAIASSVISTTGPGNIVTFTFPVDFDMDGSGTIFFPLERPCGDPGSVFAGLAYKDLCDVDQDSFDSGATVTQNSNATLFVSPTSFTQNEQTAQWRFYVSTSDPIPAEGLIITNTLPIGQEFDSYEVTSTTIIDPASLVTAYIGPYPGPPGRQVVTFTISSQPQGTRIRFDVFSTLEDQCVLPSQVDIALWDDCGPIAGTCQGRMEDLVKLLPGKFFLTTSNDQTARLPLCQDGLASLTVKNSSFLAPEFNFVITDTITNGTYVAGSTRMTVTNGSTVVTGTTTSGNPPLADVPFEPTATATANGHILQWDLNLTGGSGTLQYDILKERAALDEILITFKIKTDCSLEEVQVASQGLAGDVCMQPLMYQEDAITLPVDEPLLTITKQGRNTNTDNVLRDVVYAEDGDTVAWEITVENVGATRVTDLFVTDTVPSNFDISAVNNVRGYGSFSGSEAEWGDLTGSGGLTLTVGSPETFVITGTVNDSVCDLDSSNVAGTFYGCGTGDICLTAPVEAEAILQTRALISGTTSVGTLSKCGGVLTITIPVEGPAAHNVVVTDTLPAGFAYEDTLSVTPPAAAASWILTPTNGDIEPVWGFSSLPGNNGPEEAPNVTRIVFRVKSTTVNTGQLCPTDSLYNNQVDVEWDDRCDEGPYFDGSTTEFTTDIPEVRITKIPVQQAAVVGNVVTWTITISNVRDLVAPGILVTDVVGTGFINVGATDGTFSGSGGPATAAIVAGNVITWTPAFTLTIGELWTALITATVTGTVGTEEERINSAFVTGRCPEGCIYDLDLVEATVGGALVFDKRGPVSVTAGTNITYTITLHNLGSLTATQSIIEDYLPFQVEALSANWEVPGVNSSLCVLQSANDAARDPNTDHCIECDRVICYIDELPPDDTATVTISALVPPDTILGSDLSNDAFAEFVRDDGRFEAEDSVDTEVETEAEVGLIKTGPSEVTAGKTITYTVVLSNTGPSTSRDVDVKDLLPPGFTYVGGSSTQGLCVNSICQLGDVGVGDVITMVITATVGSDITGTVENRAEYFGDTSDSNSDNDSSTFPTLVNPLTALVISKVDLTDPVFAGNTYLYEVVVTNTGPSDAINVVVTDTLPAEVSFEGTSPECTHDGSPNNGTVTCNLGTLAAGESRDYLINVRVDSDVISGTVGTNTTGVTTTTPIDLANSILSDSEPTTYWQTFGSPTDLQLLKSVDPDSAVAGDGYFTYTLEVTNNGPAPASAVQVVDAFPSVFEYVSAVASDGSTCNSGVTCDLNTMEVLEIVVITIVVDVPADVAAGTYTNTAYVGSASPDSDPDNNDDDADTEVTNLANLQLRKIAVPDPVTPGEDLTYTILVTNTGPSDAENVTVSDILPPAFNPLVVLSSQGGCAGLPCNLGTIPAGGHASVTIIGTVDADATGGLVNIASVSSSTPGSGDGEEVITPIVGSADLALIKTATPTILAGETITYTLTVYNLGPSDATGVLVTDTLPSDIEVQSTGGCTDNFNDTLTCDGGALAVGASQTFTITVKADTDIEPGTSLENKAKVGSDTPDSNPTNNFDDADTSIVGEADLSLSKTGPITVTAGSLITYEIVVDNNAGP